MVKRSKEGFIWKLSGGRHWLKNWKRRWFVLDAGQLCYYTDAQLSECKGNIPLAGYSFRRCFRDDIVIEKAKENEERLVQKRGGQQQKGGGVPPLSSLLLHPQHRCYSLRFDTPKEAEEWERAFSFHIPVDLPCGIYLCASLRKAVEEDPEKDGDKDRRTRSSTSSGSQTRQRLSRSHSRSGSAQYSSSPVPRSSSFFSRDNFAALLRSNFGVDDESKSELRTLFEHVPFFASLSTHRERGTSSNDLLGRKPHSHSPNGRLSLSAPPPSETLPGYDIGGARYYAASVVSHADTSLILEAVDRVSGDRVAIKILFCLSSLTGDQRIADILEEQAESEVSVLMSVASSTLGNGGGGGTSLMSLKQSWSEKPSLRATVLRGHPPSSSTSSLSVSTSPASPSLSTPFIPSQSVESPHKSRAVSAWSGRIVYIVQEFAPFGTITDVQFAKEGGVFTEDEARCAVMCILRGLSTLHAAGYVHRDVKSDNCFVFSADVRDVRLGDFALAKPLPQRQPLKETAGTVGWMAPEVVEGGGYGRKADVFSVGLLAFFMLTGELPWSSADDNAVRRETLELDIPDELVHRVLDEGLSEGFPSHDEEGEENALSLRLVKKLRVLSPAALSFLETTLCRSPIERPTADEALWLPWMKG